MSTITPTVGRIVWYRLNTSQDVHGIDSEMARFNTQGEARPDPLPAMIVGINTPDRVNLVVFDAAGMAHPRTSVLIAQDGDPVPVDGGFAEWMPYQLGQAAKTESLTGPKLHGTDLAPADLSNPAGPLHFPDDGRLDFGDALKLLKKGEAITRLGWNGKGLWLELSGPGVNPDITVPFVVLCYPDEVDGRGACVPWAPSQTDMLADDWVIVE